MVTNGTFDGTHLGHDKILNQLITSAKNIDGKSVVLTYWPHPRVVLGKENDDFKLLFTIEERIELLQSYNIDFLIILEFTKEFAAQTSEEFIQNILINKIKTKKLILGYNHRFGKNREGSYEYLIQNASKYGFEIEEISKQVIDEEGISSTKIRNAIAIGDIETANNYLNKRFFIHGKVIHGKQLGRTIGFPTANIQLEFKHKIIPADGVYAVRVFYNNIHFFGMMNIGIKPSLNLNKHSLEVHIFNFNEDIYGKTLKIEFIKKIRNEIKFDSLEDLKYQLQTDKLNILGLISID